MHCISKEASMRAKHFCVCLYYTVLSDSCRLVIISWERAGILALLCVLFPSVFVTFPYDASGQVWFLIPDLGLLYF